MTLKQSLDKYLDSVWSSVEPAAPAVGWFGNEQPELWRPELALVEDVVGFSIGDDLRVLWEHPLSNAQAHLMPGMRFAQGPAGLFVGRPLQRFGQFPIPVARQIPVLCLYPDDSLVIVADAEDQASLWVGGVAHQQSVGHRLQVGLAGMFDLWVEALVEGDLVQQGARVRHGRLRDLPLSFDDFDAAAWRSYALSPGTLRGSAMRAVGGAFAGDGDLEAWFVEATDVSRRRIEAWEGRHDGLPFPLAKRAALEF